MPGHAITWCGLHNRQWPCDVCENTLQPTVQSLRGVCSICGPFVLEVRLSPQEHSGVDAPTLVHMHERTDLHQQLRAWHLVRWEATHWVQRSG